MAKETEDKTFLLPVGRLINEALFEMDAYTDPQSGQEGKPQYKVEIAFDPDDVQGEGTVEDLLIDAACEAWGDSAEQDFLDGNIISPFLSGDKLAKRREDKGKAGDAYKGKLVIRANTQFNKFGVAGPGGVQVYDEEVNEVGPANRQVIYPGCFGQAAVTIGTYTDNRGDKALKFYLSAFQKTGDGDKLVAERDHSKLFKPVGRQKGGDGEGSRRRSRKG